MLGVAADAQLHKLVTGIDNNAQRALARDVVSAIENGNRGLVQGVCITRTLDGSRVPFEVVGGKSNESAACGSAALVSKALSAPKCHERRRFWSPTSSSCRLWPSMDRGTALAMVADIMTGPLNSCAGPDRCGRSGLPMPHNRPTIFLSNRPTSRLTRL